MKHENRLFARGRQLIQLLEFLSKQTEYLTCEDVSEGTKLDPRRVRELMKEIQNQGCVEVKVAHDVVGYKARERGITSFKLNDLGLRNLIVMRTVALPRWPTLGDGIKLGLVPHAIMPDLNNPEFQKMISERRAVLDKLVEKELMPGLRKSFGPKPKAD